MSELFGVATGDVLAVAMFVGVLGMLMLGFPVAFTLGGTALAFAGTGWLLDAFRPVFLGTIASRFFGAMVNEVLVAVPLFIFMGVVLERSRLAEELLETMGELFGRMRGGLGISVIFVGALLAASTGIVGATVVTMGLISLPAMLRAGYSRPLACGIVCASGTLGQIIPPSTVLIFMGDILQGANQEAQLALGNFAPDPVSVGDLFAGAFLPGLLLVALYMAWTLTLAAFSPRAAPAHAAGAGRQAGLARRVVVAILPPLFLIVAVLGSILAGIATPTESASVGAVGALLLAGMRRQLSLPRLRGAVISAAQITSMVFLILFGASLFALVFRTLGGDELLRDFLGGLPGGAAGAMLAVMALMFALGFILDAMEIIFIVMPLTAPVLLELGVDPVWLGVMIGINLQTSFLTPPVGFSLFYLRSVAPAEVRTVEIYRGVMPFVVLQVAGLALIWLFPSVATWLPAVMFD